MRRRALEFVAGRSASMRAAHRRRGARHVIATRPRRHASRTRRTTRRPRGGRGNRAAPARRSRALRPLSPSNPGTCGRIPPRRPSCPPRCTWKASASPSGPFCTMPLKPMSATWNRAHEFGQPLTLMVIGVSKSGSRLLQLLPDRLGAVLRLDERELAELDAGAGDRAAPERRRPHGRARARRARRRRSSVVRGRDVEHDDALLRGQRAPGRRRSRSASSASSRSAVPRRASGLRRRADREQAVVLLLGRRCGRGARARRAAAAPSGSARCRYSSCSTWRNFSGPQSAIRNFIRAWLRERR